MRPAKLFVLLIVGAAVCGEALSQRDIRYEQAVSKAGPLLRPEAPGNLDANYIPHREPCQKISDVGGALWTIEYGDGFRVGNVFRACRGSAEVVEYFTGQSAGDCDSRYQGSDGRLHEVCFPRDAFALAQAHSGIRVIWLSQWGVGR